MGGDPAASESISTQGVAVREEVVEDNAGVISLVIVPTLVPVPEDAMEELESTVGSSNN